MLGFGKTQAAGLTELLAKKKWSKAIEVIREDLKTRSRDRRLRMQLADVLQRAGRGPEAVPILLELADEFALSGAAAKAIATLKRAQAITPDQPQIEEHLAYLIAQQKAPTPDPWLRAQAALNAPPQASAAASPFFPGDIEEIGEEAPAGALPPVVAGPDGEAPARIPDELEGAQAPGGAEAPPKNLVEDFPAPSDESLDGPEGEAVFVDEVMALIDDVVAGRLAPQAAPFQAVPAVDTPLFRDFTSEELVEVIHGLELRSFQPGEIILSEGEPGECIYVLTTGTVRAYARASDQRNTQIRLLREGDFFGEISLLASERRTATITAAGRCELLRIDRDTLEAIASRHPRIWDVIRRFYQERAGSAEEVQARSGGLPATPDGHDRA